MVGSQRLANALGSFAEGAAEWAARRIRRTLHLDLTERLFALRQNSRRLVSERGLATMTAATSIRLSDFLLFLLAIRFVGLGSDVFGTTTLLAIFALVNLVFLIRLTPGNAGIAEVAFIAALTAATDLRVGA